MNAKMPDFYIVGAPKCGTTALFCYLSAHPSVFMAKPKETNFFCSDIEGAVQIRDLQSYLALFADAPTGALTGEASVLYLLSQIAIPSILSLCPHAKIIVMLRNPIDVVRSLHSQLWAHFAEDIDDFEDAWNAQDDRAKGKRLPWYCPTPKLLQYAEVCGFRNQVKRVVDSVPERQRLFIVYEEFFRDPRRNYLELLSFLGLPSDGRTEFPRFNGGRAPTRKVLHHFFRKPPFPINHLAGHLRSACRALNLHPLRLATSLVKLQEQPPEREKLRPEFERKLWSHFAPDFAELEKLLGRPLHLWRQSATQPSWVGARASGAVRSR